MLPWGFLLCVYHSTVAGITRPSPSKVQSGLPAPPISLQSGLEGDGGKLLGEGCKALQRAIVLRDVQIPIELD